MHARALLWTCLASLARRALLPCRQSGVPLSIPCVHAMMLPADGVGARGLATPLSPVPRAVASEQAGARLHAKLHACAPTLSNHPMQWIQCHGSAFSVVPRPRGRALLQGTCMSSLACARPGVDGAEACPCVRR